MRSLSNPNMSIFENFAFISYSRSDLKAASFIQSSLEHFRYPRESINPEFLPDDSQFVREIFLDKTKLSGRGSSFEQNLESAIAKSRYLIVLCSPEAAKQKKNPKDKHYVEWEISTFLKHHGGDPSKYDDPREARKTEQAKKRIIPVIVSGEPDLSDSSCLPRPIRDPEFRKRNLPDMRPTRGQKLGFFGRRNTWHSAVVTLLTYVFNVERSIIFDRFTAERAKARMRICIAASIATITLLGIAGMAIFERNRRLDAAAWRHFSTAQHYLEKQDEASAFGKSNLALPHLSLASRIPTAKEYLVNQLLQRSWIVPYKRESKPLTPPFPLPTAQINRIDSPADFPLILTNINGRITAFDSCGVMKKWAANEEFNVYQARVSPVGTVMATLRHHPAFSLDGVDPYSGKILWSKRLNSMLRDFQFSSDGRRLAILSFTGKLTILRSSTGEREFETIFVGSDTQHVRFTETGDEIILDKPGHILICKLAKQFLELPLSVKDLPIVNCARSNDGTTFTLTSKCESGGFAATWNSSNLAIVDTKELNGNEVNCEYLSAASQTTQRTSTGRRQIAISLSKSTAKTTDDNCVQLFDNAQQAISEAFEMPAIIKHLNAISINNREYLIVGGGGEATAHKAKGQGFYAIIDISNKTLLHLRSGLNGQVTASFKLPDSHCLLHGTNNINDWVITLPAIDNTISHQDFKSICELLSGCRMSECEVPIPSQTITKDISTDGFLQRFIIECQLSIHKRHTSFLSSIPQSVAVTQLANGTLTDLDAVLDSYPSNPEALTHYWIAMCISFLKSEYALSHPEASTYEVEQRFSAYSPGQWRSAIAEDGKAVYFADKITSYSLSRNPTSEISQKDREDFLILSGRKSPSPPAPSGTAAEALRTFASDRNKDILSNPKLASNAAAELCANRKTFTEFLKQFKVALSNSISIVDLDFGRVTAIASLVSDISIWSMDLNGCDTVFITFLEELANDCRQAKSVIFADQLRSQILYLALEKAIRIGEAQRATEIRKRIRSIEHPDILASQMLSFYEIFYQLTIGNPNECKKLYDAARNNDSVMFEAMGKSMWDLLTEMKQHQIDLGVLSDEYAALSRVYATGIPIKILPGSVAEELGWKDGDAILKINGQTITDDKMLNAILTIRRRQERPNTAKFILLRNGQETVSETDKTTLGIQF